MASLVAVSVWGCAPNPVTGGDGSPNPLLSATTTVSSTPYFPTTAPPRVVVPPALESYQVAEVSLAGEPYLVAVADTPALRRQGLMGVADLGGLDGMLFVYEEDVTVSFHMQNTLIPLDLAFFDRDGVLLGMVQMQTCTGGPCPGYPPPGPFRWALEAPLGALQHLAVGDRLVVGTV